MLFVLRKTAYKRENIISRCFSVCTVQGDRHRHASPDIMDIPRVHLPKISFSMKNWFLSRTLIAPYFDEDFSIPEFNTGAKHACATVASSLASGDLASTKNLLSRECWQEVQSSLSSWTLEDR